MDLVLRAPDGKIHIVDYKSNLIEGQAEVAEYLKKK